ncbi:MAG: diheme cytochrome c, partial [Deltaproteobacteria bacterium]
QKEEEGDLRQRLEQTEKEWHPSLKLAFWLLITIITAIGLVSLRPEARRLSFKEGPMAGPALPTGFYEGYDLWMQECATSCHSAFHPALLPEESWRRIMDGLSGHFGNDASLDARTTDIILRYLVNASSGPNRTEASRKLLGSIGNGEAPLRITEVVYWVKKHSGIPKEVFRRGSVGSRSNCLACHPGAEVGSFDDKDIRTPD